VTNPKNDLAWPAEKEWIDDLGSGTVLPNPDHRGRQKELQNYDS
jgi:hypothetical protein